MSRGRHAAGRLSLAPPRGRREAGRAPVFVPGPGASFAFGPPRRSPVRAALRPVSATLVVAGNLTLVLAIVALLAIAVGPRTGHYRTLTMLTGSMRPIAPPGSVVVVTPQRPADLRVGQVITFNAPDNGRVVTHRVTSVRRDAAGVIVRTKGDANNAEDAWDARIAENATVWRMRLAVPGVGYAISSLRQPRVRTTVRFVLPAVLLGSLLLSIWRSKPEPA